MAIYIPCPVLGGPPAAAFHLAEPLLPAFPRITLSPCHSSGRFPWFVLTYPNYGHTWIRQSRPFGNVSWICFLKYLSGGHEQGQHPRETWHFSWSTWTHFLPSSNLFQFYSLNPNLRPCFFLLPFSPLPLLYINPQTSLPFWLFRSWNKFLPLSSIFIFCPSLSHLNFEFFLGQPLSSTLTEAKPL